MPGGKESGEVKVNMATGEGGHLTGNTYDYHCRGAEVISEWVDFLLCYIFILCHVCNIFRRTLQCKERI